MRVIDPEIDEQVVSSGWTRAIAVLMIVLGIIALVQPAAGIAFPFLFTIASTLVFGWIFIFAIRVEQSEMEILETYAEQTGRTKTDIIREYIRSLAIRHTLHSLNE